MKPYERRATSNATYYKLATWDARSFTFRDYNKVTFQTLEDAIDFSKYSGPIKKGTKCRISIVSPDGRKDMEPYINF